MARDPIAVAWNLGCTDHGCVWGHDGGMGTNGGCRCLVDDDRKTLRAANRAVRMMRVELAALREVVKAADELFDSSVEITESDEADWKEKRAYQIKRDKVTLP